MEGGAELGEAAGLGDADAEHLLGAGREQEGREARRHAPQRHLDRLAGRLGAHHLAGAADWVCITASKSCRLSGK